MPWNGGNVSSLSSLKHAKVFLNTTEAHGMKINTKFWIRQTYALLHTMFYLHPMALRYYTGLYQHSIKTFKCRRWTTMSWWCSQYLEEFKFSPVWQGGGNVLVHLWNPHNRNWRGNLVRDVEMKNKSPVSWSCFPPGSRRVCLQKQNLLASALVTVQESHVGARRCMKCESIQSRVGRQLNYMSHDVQLLLTSYYKGSHLMVLPALFYLNC